MGDTLAFTKERKGYSCKEVDKFLLEENARHQEEIASRDAEIKRLYSEKEELKERLLQAKSDAEKAASELEEFKKHANDEADRLNMQMGEKLSAATEASNKMLESTRAECEEMKRECKEKIAFDIAEAHKKAEEYCEQVRRITEIYAQKQQIITAGLEQSRRHLDDAIKSVDDIMKDYQ